MALHRIEGGVLDAEHRFALRNALIENPHEVIRQ